jgi:hypothetical protein
MNNRTRFTPNYRIPFISRTCLKQWNKSMAKCIYNIHSFIHSVSQVNFSGDIHSPQRANQHYVLTRTLYGIRCSSTTLDGKCVEVTYPGRARSTPARWHRGAPWDAPSPRPPSPGTPSTPPEACKNHNPDPIYRVRSPPSLRAPRGN